MRRPRHRSLAARRTRVVLSFPPSLKSRVPGGRVPAGTRDPWTKCTRMNRGQPDIRPPRTVVLQLIVRGKKERLKVSIPPRIIASSFRLKKARLPARTQRVLRIQSRKSVRQDHRISLPRASSGLARRLACARQRSHPGTFYSAGQSRTALSASTASHPAFRDDARTAPSHRVGWIGYALFPNFIKANYFCLRDLTKLWGCFARRAQCHSEIPSVALQVVAAMIGFRCLIARP